MKRVKGVDKEGDTGGRKRGESEGKSEGGDMVLYLILLFRRPFFFFSFFSSFFFSCSPYFGAVNKYEMTLLSSTYDAGNMNIM